MTDSTNNSHWRIINVGTVEGLQTNLNSTHNEPQTTTTHVTMPSRKRMQPQNKSIFNYLLLMFNIHYFSERLTY